MEKNINTNQFIISFSCFVALFYSLHTTASAIKEKKCLKQPKRKSGKGPTTEGNIIKYILIILFVTFQVVVYGQFDSLRFYKPHGLNASQIIYPEDGLTYNQYVGETIAGYTLANTWRKDSINGGFNKEIYINPYVSALRFEKQNENMIVFRYKQGKLFTGAIEDTFMITFTPHKIKGYFSGKPYYVSAEVKVIFRAKCVKGVLQGRGVLCGLVPQFGIYNNIPLSECNFEDGEIVGICNYWDLNSIDFEINNGNIKSLEAVDNYFEFRKLLELTETTYIKGSLEWIKQITKERNGSVKTEYPKKNKK